jgi:FAD-dependent halogenase
VGTTDFEVVVLGGGPAGSAAATLLARRGHRVALVRPTCPPAGAIAESVPPSARRILDELGFLGAVEAAGFHANRGNSVWWAGEAVRRERFEADEIGFHVDRSGLEAVLIAESIAAGVDVLDGYTARSASETSTTEASRLQAADATHRWTIECASDDGTARTLRAEWLIDATGRRGLVARSQGRLPDRSTTTIALVRRFRRDGGWSPEDAGRTVIESYPGGWAWSLPLSHDVRCFTAMIDQRHTTLEGRDVAAMLDAELAHAREVGLTRTGAQPVGDAWACPASLYTASTFGRRGLFLVGDAGSCIDPLSSFGVKKALSSGWLAGVATHSALVEVDMTDDAIAFFDARERTVYESYRRASIQFFESAADAYGTPFWHARADAARLAGAGAAAFASDVYGEQPAESDVRAAFDTIRSGESLCARPGATLRVFEATGIEGHLIVRQQHVGSEPFPAGMRYLRGVDLIKLIDVAPNHALVPDGWAAYNGVAPPVTLPDYLTALASAFAAGFLEHADG